MKYKRLWMLVLIPLAVALLLLARLVDGFTETVLYPYIYRPLMSVIARVTGFVPFSIAEWIIFAGPVLLIVYVAVCAVRSRRRHNGSLPRALMNIACIASVAGFLFVLFCSVNYYRPPLAQRMNLHTGEHTVEELYRACDTLATQANELRAQLDAPGPLNVDALHDGIDAIAGDIDAPRLRGIRPKGVLLSRVMSELNLSGFYFPLTIEANYNRDIPNVQLASTAAHELSHLMGFMREDEANFLGYYICVNSGDLSTAYSGTMLALRYCLSALYREDVERYAQVAMRLSDAVIDDDSDISAFWSQFTSPLADVSSAVNDAYLKANDQDDGVKSYGRMVDLVIAHLNR